MSKSCTNCKHEEVCGLDEPCASCILSSGDPGWEPKEPQKAYLAFSTHGEWATLGACLGVFSTREEAEEAAKGKGFYGSDGRVLEAEIHGFVRS